MLPRPDSTADRSWPADEDVRIEEVVVTTYGHLRRGDSFVRLGVRFDVMYVETLTDGRGGIRLVARRLDTKKVQSRTIGPAEVRDSVYRVAKDVEDLLLQTYKVAASHGKRGETP